MQSKKHWNSVYSAKPADSVSWYQAHAEFGEPFVLLGHEEETHHTPSGGIQKFVYCCCRKTAS